MTKQKSPAKKTTTVKHSSSARKTSTGGAHEKVLNTAAVLCKTQNVTVVDRKQVEGMCGIKGKSTLANAFTKLKKLGWMVVDAKTVQVTDEGMENANVDNVQMITTNEQHMEQVKETYDLKPKEITLMDYLTDGRKHQAKAVAAALGYKMNSTWANLKTGLRKKSIIDFDKQDIWLHDDMFRVTGRPNTDDF